MFSNLLALKLEYPMSIYQKFRDCKTAGPFFTLGTRGFFSRAKGKTRAAKPREKTFFSRRSLFKTWPKPETAHEKPLAPRVVLFYAPVWFSHARGPHALIGRGKSHFTLAPDVSFQRGFLIYAKKPADLRRKSSISLVDNLSRELRPFLCALRWGIDRQVRDRW